MVRSSSRKTGLELGFAGIGLLWALGCGDCEEQQADRRSQVRLRCYRQLKRTAPGHLELRQPVGCDQAVIRYRVEGPTDPPRVVSHLDAAGHARLTYKVRYDQDGRPFLEERIYHRKPKRFKRFGGRERVEFLSSVRDDWQVVRILTRLDPQGRPIKTEKYVGADRVYSMERVYRDGLLVSETTRDGAGKVKFRSVYRREGDRRIERMVDGAGNLLLEREVGENEQPLRPLGLDSAGDARVQDGERNNRQQERDNEPSGQVRTQRRESQ